ncbi:MAG: UDP-N-acetylglucosamine 2-epimerase [Desulfobacterales bacterium]|nr:UDP-N-acetylglucosamine 2-epimerase [Desulfobacterales bacterium]
MATVIREMMRRKASFQLLSSGQHTVIVKRLTKVFDLPLPFFLSNENVASIQDAVKWFLKIAPKIPKLLPTLHGNIVVVQGDTLSTLLGTLLAKIAHAKLAHVEAGMRSGDFFNPFPEELIRVVVDQLSDILFAPSANCCENLRREKVKGRIVSTKANTIVDAMRLVGNLDDPPSRPYAVVTLHRLETIMSPSKLKQALHIICLISKRIHTVFVAHKSVQLRLKHGNIDCKELLVYPDFIKLVSNAEFVATDSGGLQEEAYYLGKPCLLLRDKTEHEEGLGANVFVAGLDAEKAEFFLGNYQRFATKPVTLTHSPSKLIADTLVGMTRR